MKKSKLAVLGLGLLALAACGQGNQDQLNQADLNSESQNLDELSNEAANAASEENVLQSQQEQLNQDAGSGAGAKTPADENIQGM